MMMEKEEEGEGYVKDGPSTACWYSKRSTLDALPAHVRKMICFPCQSFESKLLFESGLSTESDEYAVLKEILFQHLTFDERKVEGKLYAIVAGSYPTYLGGAVKTYNDVDVFVIANEVDLVRNLLRLIHPETHPLQRYPYHIFYVDPKIHWDAYGMVITVQNFGRVQLILKPHFYTCLCDFHLDTCYFRDFHHCTRWRLVVFKDCFLAKYMRLEHRRRGDQNAYICAQTRIFRSRDANIKAYPYKHINNVLDEGPPKLSQQALHVILKNNGK